MHRKMSHSVLNFLRRLYLIDQNDFKKLKFDSSNNPMDKTTVSTSSFDFIIEGDNESAVYTTSGERVVMKEILGEEDKMDVLNDSLQGLTGMLTQISEKVVEQGQVVDRIDFNTMTSLTLTKKANKVGFDAWGICFVIYSRNLRKYVSLIKSITYLQEQSNDFARTVVNFRIWRE